MNGNGSSNDEVKTLVQMIFTRYGSLVLDIETTSQLSGQSITSLRRNMAESSGIPITKTGKAKGSDRVQYCIYDIATYIVRKKIKTYNNI